MPVLHFYDHRVYHFFKIPIKRHETPSKIQAILAHDNLSAIPNNPIEVVIINTDGPTKANVVLIVSALSTCPTFNMNKAAVISILPEMSLRVAILTTNLSKMITPFFFTTNTHDMHESLFLDVNFGRIIHFGRRKKDPKLFGSSSIFLNYMKLYIIS